MALLLLNGHWENETDMRDFTYHIYAQLLDSMLKAGYEFQTFEEFILAPKERVVILRHDSDVSSSSELKFAHFEKNLGIKASYYFRIPKTFKIDIIKEIAELGHEIGYHYEDLSVTRGNYEKAIKRFENNLKTIRKLYPVKTIAMHGRPLSFWNSKDLWKKYDFKVYDIIAEPYISVDYQKVLYLTDTGSRWNGEKMIIRDSVLSPYNFNIHSTFQLIELFNENKLPNKIILNSHPARWTNNLFLWLYRYFLQQIKNVLKYFLKKIVTSREKTNSRIGKEAVSTIEPDEKIVVTRQPSVSFAKKATEREPVSTDGGLKKNTHPRYCLLTNDVETTSIRNNRLSEKTGELVLKEGMPLLLDLYEKYKIKSTFFFTGQIAESFPEIVRMILPYGHEVGCHGYSHEVNEAFDILSFSEQVQHLKKAKTILEDISGQEVISFRAPALRVNCETPKALIESGFLIDSSVASQRFDFLMSFGSKKKIDWLSAPRSPYRTNIDNLARKGNTKLIEIPVSALIIPYIGTTMRIFPSLTHVARQCLHVEAMNSRKPIVFLIHPNEFIEEEHLNNKVPRRTNNPFKYFFADVLRNKLKLRNLGYEAVTLYEKEIEFFVKHNYKFLSIKDFASKIFPNETDIKRQ
jgi:peptidoglycan-N-acetylglucosamine deacetylase